MTVSKSGTMLQGLQSLYSSYLFKFPFGHTADAVCAKICVSCLDTS